MCSMRRQWYPWRMRAPLMMTTVAVLAALTGCVGDAPVLTGSSGGGNDGGSTSSGGTTGTNLLVNGGFEDACNGWDSSSGDLTSEPTFHLGAKSCKVCSNRTEAGLYLGREFGGAAQVGDKFVATAWLRNAAASGTASSFGISIRTLDTTQSEIEVGSQQAPVLTSDWQQVTMSFEVTKPGTMRLRVDVGASEGPTGSCFLVDDVSVSRKP